MKKQQRTPEELIAETQARLDRLQTKQAAKAALNSPTLNPLIGLLGSIQKDITKAKKGLGDGPQSFAFRIEKHQLWIDQIEAEKELADAILFNAEEVKKTLEGNIQEASRLLQEGGQVEDYVESAIQSFEDTDDGAIQAAQSNLTTKAYARVVALDNLASRGSSN
jgi:DNA repair exonuclease SbcCD ATPase subunit